MPATVSTRLSDLRSRLLAFLLPELVSQLVLPSIEVLIPTTDQTRRDRGRLVFSRPRLYGKRFLPAIRLPGLMLLGFPRLLLIRSRLRATKARRKFVLGMPVSRCRKVQWWIQTRKLLETAASTRQRRPKRCSVHWQRRRGFRVQMRQDWLPTPTIQCSGRRVFEPRKLGSKRRRVRCWTPSLRQPIPLVLATPMGPVAIISAAARTMLIRAAAMTRPSRLR